MAPKNPKTYSENNMVSSATYADGRCSVEIENVVAGEKTAFETDTEEEARQLIGCVTRYYAALERDYTYHPCGDVSTRKGSFWRFDVVGTDYCDGTAIAKAEQLVSGEMLLLVRERRNPFSPKAIRVMTAGGQHVGYVPDRRCGEVGSKMGKVGVCWVEYNNLGYGDVITVIFSFDKCRLNQIDDDTLTKPRYRVRLGSDSPFRGKVYDIQGRFKLFNSQGDVHQVMEDFGATAYWNSGGRRAELVVLGSSSPRETVEIVERMTSENPGLRVIKETELTALMQQYDSEWLSQLQKKKTPEKNASKSITSARAYISKTLKKVEQGADPLAFKHGLQERVNLILSAKEPLGESLRERLRAVGVDC